MAVCNLSLQVLPVCPPGELYAIVDRVIDMVEKTGLKYIVGPMETTIEGELDDLLQIVKNARDVCVESGVERMCFIVKIDYSTGGVTIDEKMEKY